MHIGEDDLLDFPNRSDLELDRSCSAGLKDHCVGVHRHDAAEYRRAVLQREYLKVRAVGNRHPGADVIRTLCACEFRRGEKTGDNE